MASNYEGDNPRSGLLDHRNKGVSPTAFDENSISLKTSDESRVGEISSPGMSALYAADTPIRAYIGPRRAPKGIIPNNTTVINIQADDYYQTFSKIKPTAIAIFIRPSRIKKLLFETLIKPCPKQWRITESYPIFWCDLV